MQVKIHKKKSERGSALISAIIAVILGGLLLGGFIAQITPVDRASQTEETQEKMERIIDALSIYHQTQLRLPCPADPDTGGGPEPYGTELGSGASGDVFGDCLADSETIGIVPFKTLGLSEDDARDGWKNFFTYRVNPAMGRTNFASGSPPKAHDFCRIKDIWVMTGGGPNINTNPAKALFCCPEPGNGFDVIDQDGNTLIPEAVGVGTDYQTIHSPAPLTSVQPGAAIPDILATVLVSHGRNGFGAFLKDGSRTDVGNAGAYSNDEQENADNDGLFVLRIPASEAETNYFDDMVIFRAQNLLYSELGGGDNRCYDAAGNITP